MNVADIILQLRNELDALDVSILALERLAAGRQPDPVGPLRRIDKARAVTVKMRRKTSRSIEKKLA